MATADVLDLLKTMIGRHSSGSAAGELEIVPIVIHNLSEHRSLIDACIRDAGGVFVDAADCVGGVTGELHPELGRVVEATLQVRIPGGGRSAVRLERIGDHVRPLLDARPFYDGMSGGLSLVLGIAASLFSLRL